MLTDNLLQNGVYIEGQERIAHSTGVIHKLMRGWIVRVASEGIYIKADDELECTRIPLIEIKTARIIQVRIPRWWQEIDREIPEGSIVRHFKGGKYKLLGYGIDTSSPIDSKVAIYQSLDTGMLFTRDKLEFNSVVDKDTYKNVEQHYRFEIITDSSEV